MNPLYLYLSTRDELLRIDVRNIVYFESDGNYTNIYQANNLKGVVCLNLGDMKKILTANIGENSAKFARIGKRHIINLSFVYQINILQQKLVLTDGVHFNYQLSVSREALKALKGLYSKHTEKD